MWCTALAWPWHRPKHQAQPLSLVSAHGRFETLLQGLPRRPTPASLCQVNWPSRGRHHVHLSVDVDPAHRVGSRRSGRVVVLTVDAEAMARDGYRFYRSDNGVWLTEAVPARYLDGHRA
jgi:hypothetical protein